MAHGLSDGQINKKYSSIPVLQSIGPDKIKITAAAATHIVNLFSKRLYDLNAFDTMKDFGEPFSRNLLNEIKEAIPKGIVISVASVDDMNNPLDKQLDIYTYLDISKVLNKRDAINAELEAGVKPTSYGYAKLKILCRLSAHAGIISVRTIQKNFDIGK